MTTSRIRPALGALLTTALTVALLATTADSATAASGAARGATAAQPCPFPGALCLWEGTRFRGARFDVAAADPVVGACVDLAAHRWPDGRARSGHNAGTQTARLYATLDCTGEYRELLPGRAYRFLRFPSNSVYVY
jgi:hypothetical protein